MELKVLDDEELEEKAKQLFLDNRTLADYSYCRPMWEELGLSAKQQWYIQVQYQTDIKAFVELVEQDSGEVYIKKSRLLYKLKQLVEKTQH